MLENFSIARKLQLGFGAPVALLVTIIWASYALTWGTLALMAAAGAIFINLDLLRSRSEPREADLHDW